MIGLLLLNMVLLLYMLLLIPGGFYPFYFFKFNYQNNFFIFHVFFACGGVAQHRWMVFMVWRVFFFIYLNK
ncbi:unnamed protein product [Meloidogyne enterolobii]|uniref:Uncharacterized protein n=1 Tax=Meloidogyne enterolobii TaxID=390850 RepID=A0ACB1AHT1_MELEN